MVSICPSLRSELFIKKWLKGNQMAVAVSSGLCSTPMAAGFDKELKKHANSSESGAIKIY